MRYLFFIISLGLSLSTLGQFSKKLKLEGSFGPQGNFFVRTYDEGADPNRSSVYLYNKNFIGTIGGLESYLNLSERSSLSLGYSRSINKGKKTYQTNINGVDIYFRDFQIRHTANYFTLGYNHDLIKGKPELLLQAGLVYATMQQQEIEIDNFLNQVDIDERNFKKNGLAEGGIYTGFRYSRKIDTKFDLGLKVRAYYLLSAASFEAISLTPTLTYSF